MTIEALISRLERVKCTGHGRYIARCPAHDDHGPSLSIRELDDGRILLHCFADCDVQSVLSAVNLKFIDLFPAREMASGKSQHRPFPAADILQAIAFEALVVVTTTRTILKREPLNNTDRERLLLAVSRIQAALDIGGLNHE